MLFFEVGLEILPCIHCLKSNATKRTPIGGLTSDAGLQVLKNNPDRRSDGFCQGVRRGERRVKDRSGRGGEAVQGVTPLDAGSCGWMSSAGGGALVGLRGNAPFLGNEESHTRRYVLMEWIVSELFTLTSIFCRKTLHKINS